MNTVEMCGLVEIYMLYLQKNIPARDPKPSGGSKRIMHFNVDDDDDDDGDGDVDDDDEDEGGDEETN